MPPGYSDTCPIDCTCVLTLFASYPHQGETENFQTPSLIFTCPARLGGNATMQGLAHHRCFQRDQKRRGRRWEESNLASNGSPDLPLSSPIFTLMPYWRYLADIKQLSINEKYRCDSGTGQRLSICRELAVLYEISFNQGCYPFHTSKGWFKKKKKKPSVQYSRQGTENGLFHLSHFMVSLLSSMVF